MKSSIFRAALRLSAIALAGVVATAAPALAKGAKPEAAVPGVVVQAPAKASPIPPAKRAAFDAEVARRKAWKKYRSATAAKPASGGPGVSATARAEDYPGLHELARH